MLDVNLFVANDHCDTKKTWEQIIWYRYHSININYTNHAIYLTSFDNHFQTVTDIINCRYPSYFTNDSFSDVFVIDDE